MVCSLALRRFAVSDLLDTVIRGVGFLLAVWVWGVCASVVCGECSF